MSFTPNDTRARLEGVLRTHAKRPVVTVVVARAVMFASGMDMTADKVGDPGVEDVDSLEGMRLWYCRPPGASLHELAQHHRRPLDLDVARRAVERVSSRDREVDVIVPWLAAVVSRQVKEVERAAANVRYEWKRAVAEDEEYRWESANTYTGKLYTAQRRYEQEKRNFYDLETTLNRRSAAIAMWAVDTHPNLMAMSFWEVLDEASAHQREVREVPQGRVEYRWPDGWTIQKLGPEALRVEGEIMQHCVGEYCAAVESGESIIYSLRDPDGRPHATIEVTPEGEGYIEMVRQIQGKQNAPTKPEYANRIHEWLRVHWESSQYADALLDGRTNYAGLDLAGMELSNLTERGGAIFTDADLHDAEILDSELAASDFQGANLSKASVSNTYMDESQFNDANMDGLRAFNVDFIKCSFEHVSMRRAWFRGCNFHQAELLTADIEGAFFHDCRFDGATLPEDATALARFEFDYESERMRSEAYMEIEEAERRGARMSKLTSRTER